MQRGVQQADRHRQARHRAQDAEEVLALHRENLRKRLAARVLVVGQQHLAHREDALLVEEHVLRAAEADALGAEAARAACVLGGVGVGADLQGAQVVGPAQELGVLGGQHGIEQRQLAEHDLAGRAIEGNRVPALDHEALAALLHGELAALVVDLDLRAAGHAALAHAARHDRCV